MQSRVEQFEKIRRDREIEGLSIRELARRHGVHRRAVRQALACALPPPKRRPSSRPAPALGSYRQLIDSWLEADRSAPPKQRHSARRIWERLLREQGAEVSERQVRRYVRERRAKLGQAVSETFVPLCHEPGSEAEVDFGEATVLIAGSPQKVYLFLMRSCFSGACFVAGFPRCTQQAFLEAHVAAFEFFGGVFADCVRYDNLRSAVARVMKGRRRIEADRFIALRSHYLFQAAFTGTGAEHAHEKGGVEGEVGRFRRNHLVPVPEVCSLGELNGLLAAASTADLGRTIRGRSETVGEALGRERGLLRALPSEPFDTREHASPRVNAKALATVRQNQYSLPVCFAGLKVSAAIGASEIAFFFEGRQIARHERLQGRFEISAKLDHYLELLERKPGALQRCLALRQERERGRWPECFDELWRAIAQKTSSSEAARQMVDVLLLVREHGKERVELAVRGALTAGAHDGRAVALLAGRQARQGPEALRQLPERLMRHERPAPSLARYDVLLARELSR